MKTTQATCDSRASCLLSPAHNALTPSQAQNLRVNVDAKARLERRPELDRHFIKVTAQHNLQRHKDFRRRDASVRLFESDSGRSGNLVAETSNFPRHLL